MGFLSQNLQKRGFLGIQGRYCDLATRCRRFRAVVVLEGRFESLMKAPSADLRPQRATETQGSYALGLFGPIRRGF